MKLLFLLLKSFMMNDSSKECYCCGMTLKDIKLFRLHLSKYCGDNLLLHDYKHVFNSCEPVFKFVEEYQKNILYCPICSTTENSSAANLSYLKFLIDQEFPFQSLDSFDSSKNLTGKIGYFDQIFVKKGWGHEQWIWNNESYCGKLLHFQCDKKCSFHYHIEKDEVLKIMSGKIVMKYSYEDDLDKADVCILTSGMAFHVPQNLRHQMIAEEDSVIVEFSTHHKEYDSYRIVKGD